jgi:hypothetical protein
MNWYSLLKKYKCLLLKNQLEILLLAMRFFNQPEEIIEIFIYYQLAK